MARANPRLIEAIRNTVKQLEKSDSYQWGHMGSCNCGFLAQEITKLTKEEIHYRAMQKHGDWNEQLNDYCPTSGLLMDDLITIMLETGLDTDDLKHLEKLSDKKILSELPPTHKYLSNNNKSDAILYLKTWVKVLESEIAELVELPESSVATV